MNIKPLLAATMLAAIVSPVPLVAQPSTGTGQIIVTGKYKKVWDKASKMEAEAIRELEIAKKELIDVSAKLVSAQNERDSASARAENARAEFQRLLSSQTYFADAEEAASWAGKLDEYAREWAKYEKRRKQAAEDVEKLADRQNDAQESVKKAQAKLEKARAMKAEAERASMLRSGEGK